MSSVYRYRPRWKRAGPVIQMEVIAFRQIPEIVLQEEQNQIMAGK